VGSSRPGSRRVALLVLAFAAVLLVARWSGSSSLRAPEAPPVAPEEIDGPPGTVLYLGGWEPASVELSSGLARRLPAPFGGRAQLRRVGGVTIAITGGSAWVVPAAGSPTPRRLGPADGVLDSPDAGRVWLVEVDDASTYELVEVGLADGRRLARQVLPAWAPPYAVTKAGVLIRNLADGGLELRGPGRPTRRLSSDVDAAFVDASADTAAWIDAGGLHLYDLATGRDRVVRPPTVGATWLVYGPASRTYCCAVLGAFSPSGQTLAVFLTVSGLQDPGLAVVDAARATAAAVPGSHDAIPVSCQTCVSWSGRGDWLFYLGVWPWQISAFRIGSAAASPLAVDLTLVVDSAPDGLAAV
jgi:hypothetical protein